MGGSVGVESLEGKGATFWFTAVLEKQALTPGLLPPFRSQRIFQENDPEKHSVDREVSDKHTYTPRIPRSTLESGDTNKIRLLLVEDDPTNQLVTKSILEKFDYQVDVAGNGCEALKLLEKNDYALVLMDCMMPIMSGYDATVAIRDPESAVRNHHIPVIAITAKAMQEDQDCCLAAGMNDYLSKPLELEKLLAMLKKWISNDSAETTANRVISSCEPITDVFDVAAFVKRNMGDLELSRDVAGMFVDHRPEYIQAIRSALETGDVAGLSQSAHKLKGIAANISLSLLTETAHLIESSAETGDLGKAAELLEELDQRFEQAEAAIRETLIATEKRSLHE
jgi:CheY-like chemotaxis protein/HPt (histidine-containing phosphotransfer) domain-containing protein